jgi:hypothetical protein
LVKSFFEVLDLIFRRPESRAKNENECDDTLKIFLISFSFSFFALIFCPRWKRHGTQPAGYSYYGEEAAGHQATAAVVAVPVGK